MSTNVDKEIAKEITIAIIQKVNFITNNASKEISAEQAIEKNGEAIAKLYSRIYKEISEIN